MLPAVQGRRLSGLVQKRGYANVAGHQSNAKAGLTFEVQPLMYSRLLKIKKQRFGQELQEWKTVYEEPLVKLHSQIREAKVREEKKWKNKQASKANRLRRSERRISKEVEKETVDKAEFKMQETLKTMLDEPEVTLAQFVVSGDPRVRELAKEDDPLENIKMSFDAFDEEAVQSDRWWSLGYLNAAFMPDQLKLNPSQRWSWEKQLPESEWLKVISSEILAFGLPLREEMKLVEGSLETITDEDFEQQGARLSPPVHQVGLQRPFPTDYMPVDVSSPIVLKTSERAVKRFKKARNHINREDECPFVIETDEYPIVTAMGKKTDRIPAEQLHRKAKLRVNVKALNLPEPVVNRLAELTGDRFDHTTSVLTLVSAKQPNRDANIAQVYKLAGAFFNEAWKADLNYVPLVDPLLPHQQVQRDVELATQKAAHDAQFALENIPQGKFTLFRVSSYPSPTAVEVGRKHVQSLVQEIKSLEL